MLQTSPLHIVLTAMLVACGGDPGLPDATALVDDVRTAMDAAPTFRFESEQMLTTPSEGTHVLRITSKVAGDGIFFVTESVGKTPARRGGMAIVRGKVYTSDSGHWQVSEAMQPLSDAPRSLLLSPDELINASVHTESEDGATVWALTTARLLNPFEGTGITTSIEPMEAHSWVVDPATSRLLHWESGVDFGTVTYPADLGIESEPERRSAVWRFYDYGADITITAPSLNDLPPPTPWPTNTPTP